MESSERAQETPARSGLSWLLAATLVWRLCSFGSESNTLDALFSCLFAALALGFVWQSQVQTKGLGFLRWWLCWALAHLALWPFWPMPFEQVLRLPALLGPVFLAVAMGWAPPSLTGRLPTVLALSGFAHAVASLWQRFFLYPDLLQQQSELGLTKAQIFRISEGRTLGLSASPDLSAAIGMAALFACLGLLNTRPKSERPMWGIAFVVVLCGLILNGSTGVFLATAVGLAVVLGRYSNHLRSVRPWGFLLGAGTIAAAVLGFRGVAALTTSSHERLLNWRGAWRVFSEHWGVGVGPAGFGPSYELFRPVGSNITRYAHSMPLQTVAELGIAGLLLLLGLGLILLRLSKELQPARAAGIQSWLWGGLVGLVAHACIDYDFQSAQTVCLLVIVPFAVLNTSSEREAFARFATRTEKITCGVLVLGLIGGTWFLTERQKILQQTFLAPSPSHAVAAQEVLETWVARYPGDLEARLALMATVFRQQAQCAHNCDTVTAQSQRLTLQWTKANFPVAAGWLLSARMALARGERAEAKQMLNHALRLHPGMSSAWLLKLETFSDDPQYPAWYKEAEGWLHGPYHLKGLPVPDEQETQSP